MTPMKSEHEQRLKEYRELIESHLEEAMRSARGGLKVTEAMSYGLIGGGKRLRGILTLEFNRLNGGEDEKAVYIASAVEMIHAFSLIHDDLPCMDNDDLRRGKPSCHKAFGEATALLAGDALLALAFQELSVAGIIPGGLKPERVVKIMSTLAYTAGTYGLIGGQQSDMDFEKAKVISEDDLIDMYVAKTAKLISTACACGVIAAGGSEKKEIRAYNYGQALGKAFQINDDILDITGGEQLGKPAGSDKRNGKKTLPLLIGVNAAREKAGEYSELAAAYASEIRGGEFLSELALSLNDRRN